jgi:EAL domain-containing protein (putative c-di-GMP-specific phosphodiesterase class I)
MDVLNAAGVRPSQIAFEVVETDKVQSQRELKDVLRAYRKAGFKVALDDVGAGYSTLLSLAEMRPDYIKLDGELVRRSAESNLEAKLVRDLAETARQNGIITIAEGIETAGQMQSVLGAGVRITQGYFHGRPQASPLDAEIAVCALARIANASREAISVAMQAA